MEQKKLRDELSRGEVRNVYLLYGAERFLVKHYAAAIEKAVATDGDKNVFDGALPVSEIIMAAETLPFSMRALPPSPRGEVVLSKRLIFVRDSKLFAAGRKADSEEMAEYFSKIPTSTIMVFIETEVDRRTKIFKNLVNLSGTSLGAAVEFTPLNPQDLSKWIIKTAKSGGKKMTSATANFLIRTCGAEMFNLSNEIDKLIHYSASGKSIPDKNEVVTHEITQNHILEICTPTLESRIFDLTKAVGAGNIPAALQMYHNLLFLKESPLMILSMIIRQLRIILLCKSFAAKNTPHSQIAKELNIRGFVIPEALSHGRRFTNQQLMSALKNCQDTDIRIKSGLLSPETGVEMLIFSI